MTSAVEPDCNKSTAGLFAKLHQESALQGSWLSFPVSKPDAISATVSKEAATAFSSFKKPFEAIQVLDLVEGDRYKPPASHQGVDSIEGNYSACNVSEPLQADGPSTPMRYLPRTKYVCADTPENVFSLSFSLATGSSRRVDKGAEWVEKCAESNMACSSKGLMYPPSHPMKLNHPASTLRNSYRRIMSRAKQEEPEFYNENMVSASLAKSERVKQLVQPSSYVQTFGSLAMTKTSISEGIDVQCQDVFEHMSSQMHVSSASTTVYIEDSQQSFRSLPRNVGFAECPSLHSKTEQDIICFGNQQERNTAGSADITYRSASREQCAPWQPVTHTFSVLQCENTLHGTTTSLQYSDPEMIVSTPACATDKCSIGNSTLYHTPILQIPLKSNDDDRHGSTNEGNLYYKNNSMSGKKRKSRSCIMKQEVDSARCLTQETDCSLKSREKPESMTEDTQCFVKTREQTEDHQNCLPDKERFSQTKRQGDRIICQNQNSISLDPMKKHIIFTAGVEACLTGSKAVQLPTLGGHCQSLGLKPLTFPAHSPMPAALSTFSSGGPSLPQLMVHTGKLSDSGLGGKAISKDQKPCQRMTSPETDWGKFLALSATSDATQMDLSKKEILLPYQQRFAKLQSFLKQCDEPDEEYLQAVRSLPATARSRHAVELETRAIMLSLEEAKELQRMKMLNVFGKDFQNSTNDSGSTPQGPRLPAPGSGKTPKMVSRS